MDFSPMNLGNLVISTVFEEIPACFLFILFIYFYIDYSIITRNKLTVLA